MFWYIFFVRTRSEYQVEQIFKRRLDTEIFRPFVPIQERLFKRAGKIKKEITPLFPGYVFVESELSGRDFLIRTRDLMRVSCAVVGLLRYSDTEVAMRESERQILLCLCDGGNCIKSSSGIIEKDRILITDGL